MVGPKELRSTTKNPFSIFVQYEWTINGYDVVRMSERVTIYRHTHGEL